MKGHSFGEPYSKSKFTSEDWMQTTMGEYMLDFIFTMKQILIFQIIKDSLIHVMKSNQLLMLNNYWSTVNHLNKRKLSI